MAHETTEVVDEQELEEHGEHDEAERLDPERAARRAAAL